VLAKRYALSPFEVAKLRGEAERLEEEAPDTVRFTRAIKDAVPYDDRVKVIESLWDIVLADGERDHEEDAILRLVAPMLGVNDRDSNLARNGSKPRAHDRLLPMYAFPARQRRRRGSGQASATGCARSGIDAPDKLTLTPGDLLPHWTDPALLLSQTCGRPYKEHLHGTVRLVGTPDYGSRAARPGITKAS
jgi:hypothetical protein